MWCSNQYQPFLLHRPESWLFQCKSPKHNRIPHNTERRQMKPVLNSCTVFTSLHINLLRLKRNYQWRHPLLNCLFYNLYRLTSNKTPNYWALWEPTGGDQWIQCGRKYINGMVLSWLPVCTALWWWNSRCLIVPQPKVLHNARARPANKGWWDSRGDHDHWHR